MRIIFAIFLCIVSVFAFAEDWARIRKVSIGTIYVDTGSIKREGRLMTALILVDFRQPQTDRETQRLFRSALSNESYDCRGNRAGTTDYTTYSGNMGRGTVIHRRPVVALDLKAAPPESLAEARLKYVCAYTR